MPAVERKLHPKLSVLVAIRKLGAIRVLKTNILLICNLLNALMLTAISSTKMY